MQTEKKSARNWWIDFAKLFAIIGVLIDHTRAVIPNRNIVFLSMYSVSLFVLIMGYNTYISYSKLGEKPLITKIGKQLWNMAWPYIIASVLYVIADTKFFNFEGFIDRLIHFNASSPLYYAMLYFMLVLISPFIYLLFSDNTKNKWIWEIGGLIILLIFAVFSINNSNILSIFGGGGKAFGGTYPILLFIGMFWAKHTQNHPLSFKTSLFSSIIFISFTVIWAIFIANDNLRIDSFLPYGIGKNPPSISLITYACLIFISISLIGRLFETGKFTKISKVMAKLSWLGQHTLYIFLFHRLFLDYVIPSLTYRLGIVFPNLFLKGITYFSIMICGSLILEFFAKGFYWICKNTLKYFDNFDRWEKFRF